MTFIEHVNKGIQTYEYLVQHAPQARIQFNVKYTDTIGHMEGRVSYMCMDKISYRGRAKL